MYIYVCAYIYIYISNQGRSRAQVSQWGADAEKATAEANKETVLVVNYYCRVGSQLLLVKVDFGRRW